MLIMINIAAAQGIFTESIVSENDLRTIVGCKRRLMLIIINIAAAQGYSPKVTFWNSFIRQKSASETSTGQVLVTKTNCWTNRLRQKWSVFISGLSYLFFLLKIITKLTRFYYNFELQINQNQKIFLLKFPKLKINLYIFFNFTPKMPFFRGSFGDYLF